MNQNGPCNEEVLPSLQISRIDASPWVGMKSARGVVAIMLKGNVVVSEFELPSLYFVNFRTNTIGKGMNSIIHPAMGSIGSILFFNKDCFDVK